MLYVSVRWSRLVADMRSKSSGRIGRIVAIFATARRYGVARMGCGGGGSCETFGGTAAFPRGSLA